MTPKPDCYQCRWRGTIPGDAHSKCRHPKVEEAGIDTNPFGAMVDVMGGKASAPRRSLAIRGTASVLTWPANYDPAFLDNCKGFKEKR